MAKRLTPHVQYVQSRSKPGQAKSYTALQTVRHRFNIDTSQKSGVGIVSTARLFIYFIVHRCTKLFGPKVK